ncbi:hepatic sodium/bile acid cotransporter [Paralichthys olivaceus]|uniref:hepatic sodium/bile acid cotransporter n=1 Tax=Paralichthys olivaceus TaxID=8255 RepID=UPI00097DDBE6|nr:PREDICTED: sodium/bile acid cotransporter [Paralichthys olivaceus]XP_019940408.1 PREDICTED: sodium/bile acid cotransporter [Paralichthys olivaceus]
MNVTEVEQEKANIYSQGNATGNGSVDAMSILFPYEKTLNIVSLLILIITMISLGCTMEISRIKNHFLSPKGVIIATVSQFGIMPLTAFCLAKILQMDNMKAVALLICGCCPGGTLSNILTLAIKGDMNLSIVLTTCSSFTAMALMPLLLFIYCRGFPGLEKAIPYVTIITTLLLTLVPCGIGIAIKHYKPKSAVVVKKVGLIILTIFIIIPILSCAAIKDVLWLALTADTLTAAALMPLIGYVLGYVLSLVCGLNAQCRRTISMETGCQNIQLCFAILKVAFSLKTLGPSFFFPLLYMAFQCIEAFLLTLCLRCYLRFKAPAEDTSYNSVDTKHEAVNQP